MIALGGGWVGASRRRGNRTSFAEASSSTSPFDGRAPSYDDTGTAAQENIAVMWEWEFWRTFLDTLARNRYNVLTLWTNHPYPGIVDLKKYPGVSYDNVCRLRRSRLRAPIAISTPSRPDGPGQRGGRQGDFPRRQDRFLESRVFDHAERARHRDHRFPLEHLFFGRQGETQALPTT